MFLFFPTWLKKKIACHLNGNEVINTCYFLFESKTMKQHIVVKGSEPGSIIPDDVKPDAEIMTHEMALRLHM